MSYRVYRCFDKNDKLLYVGSSMLFLDREPSLRGRAWFKAVRTIRLSYYKTKEGMLRAERAAIKSEGPKYNLMCTEKYSKELKERNAEKRRNGIPISSAPETRKRNSERREKLFAAFLTAGKLKANGKGKK